jgi:hypothetical protein
MQLADFAGEASAPGIHRGTAEHCRNYILKHVDALIGEEPIRICQKISSLISSSYSLAAPNCGSTARIGSFYFKYAAWNVDF